jgi:hypothetical protein
MLAVQMMGRGLIAAVAAGRYRRRVLLRAPLLAALFLLALAPAASAFVYWADSQNQRIGRAENDGSRVDDSFIPSTGALPVAVAVDGGHVYWANENGNSIGRASIDGSAVDNSFITGITHPSGVAVNGSWIFWSSLDGKIGRAALSGASKNAGLVSGLSEPCGVALDSGHVYWVEDATGSPAYIARAGFEGGSQQLTYVTIPGTSFPCGVAVNSANIFWSDAGFFGGGTRIGRANTNNGGGADASFIGDASTPCGVAVSGTQLYWANTETNAIARANTDGTAVNESFIATGGSQICGVAVDALAGPPATKPSPQPSPAGDGQAPETRIARGPGKGLAKGRATFRFRSSEAGSSFACKLDGRKAKPCRSPRSYTGLKPGQHVFKVWATDAAGNKDPTPAKRRFAVPAP